MEDIGKTGFSWWYIIVHLIAVGALAYVAICYISKSTNVTITDYISGVGSIASVYGILIALWQIWQTRTAAQAAEAAAIKKSKEIEKFMSYANISRHIEIANSIPPFLASKQYEAAIIKIDQLKELVVELRESKDVDGNDRKTAVFHVIKLGTDIVSLRKQLSGYNSLDADIIITHVTDVNTYLQEISAKLKKKEL